MSDLLCRVPQRVRWSWLELILLVLAGSSQLYAQNHPDSPVFKDYKKEQPVITFQQSDVTYQLWQGFLVARKANTGDMLAQHELGIRYLMGRGFDPDTVKAAYWIAKAAAQNLTTARFNLGILLVNGWGVEWNPFEAYQHFLYCAQEQMVQAQYILGQFLTDNLVVPRNWPEAYRWVKIAADSGFAPAKEILPLFEKKVQKPIPARNEAGATRSVRDSAAHQANLITSQSLGLVFLNFEEDTTSQIDDVALLKEALRSGGREASNALGGSSALEEPATVDTASLLAVQRAAAAGSPEALTLLGRCYEKGIVVSRDKVVAAGYYARAVRLDSPRAPALLYKLIQEKETADHIKSRAEHADPDAEFAWAVLYALGLEPLLMSGASRLTDGAALHLLKEAAERHHVLSLVELGLCYYAGRWVPQNVPEALQLWREAAQLGSREAEIRTAATQVRTAATVEEQQDAIAVLSRGESDGSVLAEMALGYCYETGTGVMQRKGEAAKLYRSAASRGSQDALRALKRMHDELRPPSVEFRIPD